MQAFRDIMTYIYDKLYTGRIVTIIFFDDVLFPTSFLQRFEFLNSSLESLGDQGRANMKRLEQANIELLRNLNEHTQVKIVAYQGRARVSHLCRTFMPEVWAFCVRNGIEIVECELPHNAKNERTELQVWAGVLNHVIADFKEMHLGVWKHHIRINIFGSLTTQMQSVMGLSQRNSNAIFVRAQNVRFLRFEKNSDALNIGIVAITEQVEIVTVRLDRLLHAQGNVNSSVRDWAQSFPLF